MLPVPQLLRESVTAEKVNTKTGLQLQQLLMQELEEQQGWPTPVIRGSLGSQCLMCPPLSAPDPAPEEMGQSFRDGDHEYRTVRDT